MDSQSKLIARFCNFFFSSSSSFFASYVYRLVDTLLLLYYGFFNSRIFNPQKNQDRKIFIKFDNQNCFTLIFNIRTTAYFTNCFIIGLTKHPLMYRRYTIQIYSQLLKMIKRFFSFPFLFFLLLK